jgi:hypothetical protein
MYYLDTNEHVIEGAIFSSPGQRPSEFLPSLGIRLSVRPSIVRRKLFQKSSPLKLLDQLKPNLV